MTVEVADIADEAFGGELCASRIEAAVAAARSLIDASPDD